MKYPKIIKENGFSFSWDEKKVWNLKIPTKEIELKEIEWMFKLPFWDYNNERFVLKPIDVLENPKKYKEEYERTMNANEKYPIDIMWNEKIGKHATLDGLHRALKLKILGKKKIIVRIITKEYLDKIKK